MAIPRELAEQLLQWYAAARRDLPWRAKSGFGDPYRVWISEVMLQQTRVEAVIPYFKRFLNAFPDVHTLANASEEHLLKLWEGLGYYSRARNLQKAARELVDRYNGVLPADAAALRRLPGIGAYTAGAIASIAYNLPEPAVDGNVLRVLSRLDAQNGDITDPAVKTMLTDRASALVKASGDPGSLNQALMDLGAMICVPNGFPRCDSCPWAACCAAKAQSIQAMLPVKRPKKPRRIENWTPVVLFDGSQLALRKRTEGVLQGLWEFPMLADHLTPESAAQTLLPANVYTSAEALPPCKHIFTHIEWHMTPVLLRCDGKPDIPGLRWVTVGELDASIALPSAFRAIREALICRILKPPRKG